MSMRKLPLFLLAGCLLAGSLSACQTVALDHGMASRQLTVLKANGFKQVGDNWELGLADRLLFATDDSQLMAPQRDRLDQLAHQLVAVQIIGAHVEGNTDATGSADYNLQLSRRRAASVKSALLTGGMDGTAVQAIGLGKSHPIASNDTAAGRRENRRVVIIVSPADLAHP
jgi:outer membrane protein OmpA-like peptidoglycan-associated protein